MRDSLRGISIVYLYVSSIFTSKTAAAFRFRFRLQAFNSFDRESCGYITAGAWPANLSHGSWTYHVLPGWMWKNLPMYLLHLISSRSVSSGLPYRVRYPRVGDWLSGFACYRWSGIWPWYFRFFFISNFPLKLVAVVIVQCAESVIQQETAPTLASYRGEHVEGNRLAPGKWMLWGYCPQFLRFSDPVAAWLIASQVQSEEMRLTCLLICLGMQSHTVSGSTNAADNACWFLIWLLALFHDWDRVCGYQIEALLYRTAEMQTLWSSEQGKGWASMHPGIWFVAGSPLALVARLGLVG